MTTDEELMHYWEWIDTGIKNGWCSEVHCGTHEATPMTEDEETEWEEGYDPCLFIIRLWSEWEKPE